MELMDTRQKEVLKYLLETYLASVKKTDEVKNENN